MNIHLVNTPFGVLAIHVETFCSAKNNKGTNPHVPLHPPLRFGLPSGPDPGRSEDPTTTELRQHGIPSVCYLFGEFK